MYVHIITKAETAELFKGDGTVVPKMTSTTFRIFRKNTGNDPFSAMVTVTDLPAAAGAKADMLMKAFSLTKHKPGALKAKKPAKKAARAVKKKTKRG